MNRRGMVAVCQVRIYHLLDVDLCFRSNDFSQLLMQSMLGRFARVALDPKLGQQLART